MNLEDIAKYKEELEAGIKKCMNNPVCERSANAIDSMVMCWTHINDMENMIRKQFTFTPEKAEKWLMSMENEDGTTGAHWNLDATKKFKPTGLDVSDWCWETTMNMMYSDYYSVAVAHGVNNPEFYADLAEAFLKDRDSKSKNKLAAYYNCIVDVE